MESYRKTSWNKKKIWGFWEELIVWCNKSRTLRDKLAGLVGKFGNRRPYVRNSVQTLNSLKFLN